MLNIALALAARGFDIFPADPETRKPLVKWGSEATRDAPTLRGWWEARPDAMPSIALSARDLVVDIDPRNGGDKTLDALLEAHPELVPAFRAAPRVTTARGGMHFYFTLADGQSVKNGPWEDFGKGIDLKTKGGFVVAPGAVRKDGLRYGALSEAAPVAAPELIVRARARDAVTAKPVDPPVIWSVANNVPEAMTPGLVALLAPRLNEKGSRHDVARALGGALALTGWTDEAIGELVGALPSDASRDRVRDALDAAARARAGEPVPQWGALERAGYAPGIVTAARTMADGGKLAAAQPTPAAQQTFAQLSEPAPSDKPDLWGGFKIGDITKPLPPIPYVCEALNLAPGAPSIMAGYGGLGKSMLAQAFVVSVATGRSFLGTKPIQNPGRVLHFDYEQGRRECESRYARLACELFKSEKEIGGVLAKLEVFSPPPIYMNGPSPHVEDALKFKCTGITLAVIDSLRACCPGVDENDSQMREPLDMLLRVSDATGCTFLVIHHARKSGNNAGGANENMRGTSAINDAAQTVIMCRAIKDDDDASGFNVTCAKARNGKKFPTFALALQDTQLDRPFLGLKFATIDAAAVAEARQKAENDSDEGLVLRVIRESPGGVFPGGTEALKLALRGKLSKERTRDAAGTLILSQRIVEHTDSANRKTLRILTP